jgi:hypothetical protein
MLVAHRRWLNREDLGADQLENIRARPNGFLSRNSESRLSWFTHHRLQDSATPKQHCEEFPANAAWRKATGSCGQMIRDMDGDLSPGHELELEATDEFSNPLYGIHVRRRQTRKSPFCASCRVFSKKPGRHSRVRLSYLAG